MGNTLRRAGLFSAGYLAVFLATTAAAQAGDTPASDAAAPPVARELLLDFLIDPDAFTLLDARSPAEFEAAHITGAINIPAGSARELADRLPADHAATIIVYCRTGKRAAALRSELEAMGYSDVRVLRAGQVTWFDGMAVFNCATPSPPHSAGELSVTDAGGSREEK